MVGAENFDRCWHVGKCEHLKDQPYGRRFRASWAGGRLYYLGPQAVETLVREYLFFPGELDGEIFEDKAVGDVLARYGIKGLDTDLPGIFGIDVEYEPRPGVGRLAVRARETPNLQDAADVAPPANDRNASGNVIDAAQRREHWESLFASREDPWRYDNSYEATKYEQTLSLLPEGRFSRALELACAEGHFTDRLSRRVEHLTAADISPTAVARTRARCAAFGNVDFLVLDLVSDALPADLDLIVCSEVLYYLSLEQLKEVPAKFANALRPGGFLLMAHAIMVSDERERTGFDWGHDFGVKTIAATFDANPELSLLQELRTPLYRIQLFQRHSGEPQS
jgi:SAM-dependent methyltransferase